MSRSIRKARRAASRTATNEDALEVAAATAKPAATEALETHESLVVPARGAVHASEPSRALFYASVLCASACFLSIGLWLAGRQSAAYDEVTDVGSGYALLRGNWRLDPEHLPLPKLIAALGLPSTLPEVPVPPDDAPSYGRWVFGNKILYETGQAPLALLRSVRAPVIWFNALLIPLIAWFTWRVGGRLAAMVAIALACTEPLWIAHATLVASDAIPGVFIYATAGLAYMLVNARPKYRWALAAGLCSAAALGIASKYYTPAALGMIWISAAIDAHRAQRLRSLGVPLLGAGALAVVLGVCCAWGWPFGPSRYFYGLQQIGKTYVTGYSFYAFGDFFRTTHRFWFAQALAVKTSISVLALTAIWAVVTLRKPAGLRASRISTLLWMPPLGHLIALSLKVPPLGVRYMLPVLPFLFTLAGLGATALLAQPLGSKWSWKRGLLPALACLQLWSVSVALQASPLSFFNGLGCYTGEVPPCLDDSNVDWGHALPALGEAIESRFHTDDFRIAYFGSSPFQAYLPHARAMTQSEWTAPQRALYAISLHSYARSPDAAWTHQQTPALVVAGAYAVYDMRGDSSRPQPPTPTR